MMAFRLGLELAMDAIEQAESDIRASVLSTPYLLIVSFEHY
jgi:hypothetical protein